jgi:choline dehydrogenase-like flavoprotein
MIVDARELRQKGPLRFDVCIIGAGPAGIAMAWELRNAGISVGLLESGGLGPDAYTQGLYTGSNVGRPYFDLDDCRARYFGGSTNWWVAMTRTFDEIDFAEREWVPYSGWPFPKAELGPHYARAQEFLGLAKDSFEIPPKEGPGTEGLPLQPGTFDSILFAFGSNLIWHEAYRPRIAAEKNLTVVLRANVVELLVGADGRAITGVTARTLDGKNLEVASDVFVLATGGLENPRILLASNSTIPAGIGNGHDLVGRFFMEHPNVGIGLFTPRDPGYRSALYTRHQTPEGLVQGALVPSREVQEREGLLNTSVAFERPGFTLRDFFDVLPGGFGDWINSIRLEARKRDPLYRLVERVEQGLLAMSLRSGASDLRSRIPGLRVHGSTNGTRAWTYRVYSRSEQQPNPASRVTLGRDKDALGMPRLVLDWRLTDLDTRTLTWTRDRLASLLGDLGTFDAFPNETIDRTLKGGWHHMGTTRMASDPGRGVVDQDCRVHGVDNLYIAGSSVFPTGGYANPTLTIVALATRLSDHIRRRVERVPSVRSEAALESVASAKP